MSTVPPPQSKTITTLSFVNCYFTTSSESSQHYIDAPSGSKQSKRLGLICSVTIPASIKAFRMKCLCSSLHKAGTVSTHLIHVFTTLPICSCSFKIALSAMCLKDSEITHIRGICLPSSEIANSSICSKCIL